MTPQSYCRCCPHQLCAPGKILRLTHSWDRCHLVPGLGRALGENGVAFRRLHGAGTIDAALSTFRQSAEVRALLLPLKSGANGITLVEAQHVFLAEPLLEREVEAQVRARARMPPR